MTKCTGPLNKGQVYVFFIGQCHFHKDQSNTYDITLCPFYVAMVHHIATDDH